MNVTAQDIAALERAGDTLMRAGAERSAVEMYALALKLRAALGVWDSEDVERGVRARERFDATA